MVVSTTIKIEFEVLKSPISKCASMSILKYLFFVAPILFNNNGPFLKYDTTNIIIITPIFNDVYCAY